MSNPETCPQCGAVLLMDRRRLTSTRRSQDGKRLCGDHIIFADCPSCGQRFRKQCGQGRRQQEWESIPRDHQHKPDQDSAAVAISAQVADITNLDVDAIVNAANEQLAPGGGVCGAIHRAAGPDLAEACKKVGFCPTGEARITPGFFLKARFVIHAVGPVWHGGAAGEPEKLASAYRSSLRLAQEHQLTSIAFPAISTGIYGYPLDAATQIAVATVREFMKNSGSIERVVFACFSDSALEAYRRAGIAD